VTKSTTGQGFYPNKLSQVRLSYAVIYYQAIK